MKKYWLKTVNGIPFFIIEECPLDLNSAEYYNSFYKVNLTDNFITGKLIYSFFKDNIGTEDTYLKKELKQISLDEVIKYKLLG